VVGLNVRLEDGGDRRGLGVGERDVLVDQVDVRIYHGQLASALAAEQIRGAGGFVVEQLAEEQGWPPGRRDPGLDKVSIDRLNSQQWTRPVAKTPCSRRSL
jgi:hypothetical protein